MNTRCCHETCFVSFGTAWTIEGVFGMSVGVRGVDMRRKTDGWRRPVEDWCASSLVRGRLVGLYDESDVTRVEAAGWSRCLTGREAVVALRPSQ